MSKWTTLALGLAIAAPAAQANVLIEENFADDMLRDRGWYDLHGVFLSYDEYYSAPAAVEFRFARGALTPDTRILRRKFEETESVYLSYRIKYSDNWVGSQQPQHPHMFHLLTNLDSDFKGPAETFLTAYVEEIGGRMQWAIQDTSNINQNRLNQDLTGSTENRAVAGCNGDGDAQPGRCYRWGNLNRNIKDWKADVISFDDRPGATYKGQWHHVESYIQLNSIVDGRGVADGQLKLWVNGELLIDEEAVLLRTGQNANMRFDQLVISPYIGATGSPVEQTFWVDDVILATERPSDSTPAAEVVPVALPQWRR